ncbi:hypothetical protein IJG04_03050 [Candidatus Saccharibacteria bacterium]|nr:hypothetical protein [Candidatus Saccharibacteria bacterium]
MIKVFYGDDRVQASKAIREFLGEGYEVIDCTELTPADLPTIFLGMTLFAEKRRILLRDFLANKAVAEHLPEYLQASHDIAIFEMKLDKRTGVYKALKDAVEFKEFKIIQAQNINKVFDIYRVAKKDGRRAVQMLAEIEPEQEPLMFLGLLVTQAIRDFAGHQGVKEKRVLHELSKVDLQIKSTATTPWLLIESFLLRLAWL